MRNDSWLAGVDARHATRRASHGARRTARPAPTAPAPRLLPAARRLPVRGRPRAGVGVGACRRGAAAN